MKCNLFQGEKAENAIEAYLLGFMYADGTILYKSIDKTCYSTMKIDLAIQDKDFLLLVNEYLCGNIKYYTETLNEKTFDQIRLAIYDVAFVKRIINLGITHNKTYEESDFVFENIPDNLKWDFIRGYFDGDGCITINKKGQAFIEMVCHNHAFINSLHQFISKFIPTNSKVTKGDGVWRIRYGGNRQVNQLSKLLYGNNPELKMDRKYQLIHSISATNKTSKYKHIKKISGNKLPYKVWFIVNGTQKICGSFSTEDEALIFYNQECEKYNLSKQERVKEKNDL